MIEVWIPSTPRHVSATVLAVTACGDGVRPQWRQLSVKQEGESVSVAKNFPPLGVGRG